MSAHLAWAGCLLVVVIVFAVAEGSGSTAATERTVPRAPAPRVEEPRTPAAQPTPGGRSRVGKTPGRAAPEIDPADIEAAERHYDAASAKWTEGQRARRAGDSTAYTEAIQEAWTEIHELRAAIEEYTDWYSEADFEEWAIPAAYDAFSQRLDRWDRLALMVKKVRQLKR